MHELGNYRSAETAWMTPEPVTIIEQLYRVQFRTSDGISHSIRDVLRITEEGRWIVLEQINERHRYFKIDTIDRYTIEIQEEDPAPAEGTNNNAAKSRAGDCSGTDGAHL